jgi:hypothetical protein
MPTHHGLTTPHDFIVCFFFTGATKRKPETSGQEGSSQGAISLVEHSVTPFDCYSAGGKRLKLQGGTGV